MKKILNALTIFICIFLIDSVEAKTIHLKECEYTEEYIKYLELSDKEKETALIPQMCKNSTKDKFTLVGASISGVNITDSKFDLRDYDMVTGVKNQGTTGACWAFATNASIESNLLMNDLGEYDLSEAHLELALQNTHDYGRTTFSRAINSGGNYLMSQAYFMNGWGPVEETYLPFSRLIDLYASKDTIESSLITSNDALIDVNSSVILGNDGACTDATIEDIKEYLISEGALATTLYLDSYYSRKEYLLYDGSSYEDLTGETIEADQSINHGVTIIGWDDTISKDKFSTTGTSSRNGAFIIKNSYGEKNEEIEVTELRELLYSTFTEEFNNEGITDASLIPESFLIAYVAETYGIETSQVTIEDGKIYSEVGNEGYHYVSYDDVHICNNVVGFSNIDKDIEDNNYGYSNLGFSGTVQAKDTTVYMLNYFDKKSSEDEVLKEVVMVFTKPNQRYTIYFADKKTNDISEAIEVASGTSKMYGYETINVTNKKITSASFTIFVKLEDTENVTLAIAYKPILAIGSMYNNFVATEEVQYISLDATEYSDVGANSSQAFNFPLKVNTNLASNETDMPKDEEKTDDESSVPETPKEETKEEINTDGKIEFEENDYNKEHNGEEIGGKTDVDTTIENPKTGIYLPIILVISLVAIGVTINIKNKKKSKVFKI